MVYYRRISYFSAEIRIDGTGLFCGAFGRDFDDYLNCHSRHAVCRKADAEERMVDGPCRDHIHRRWYLRDNIHGCDHVPDPGAATQDQAPGGLVSPVAGARA